MLASPKPALELKLISRRKLLALFAAAAGAAATTSCTPPQTRTIRIATPQFSPALGNPFMGLTLPSTLILDTIYDSLTVLEKEGRASAGLSTHWIQVSDYHWRFYLRDGASFSNGRPLNAAALARVFELLNDARGRLTSVGSELKVVEAAKPHADYVLDLFLREPTPLLPALLSTLRIPEPGAYRRLSADAFAADPIGSGPFKVERWHANSVLLSARNHLWRPPMSDKLEIVLTPDRTARLQAILSGTMDAALEISPDDVAALHSIGGQVTPRMTTSVLLINFITNNGGALADMRVRKALNLAVNRQKLIDAFLPGYTSPANQFASEDGFGRNPDLEPITYNPDEAKRLLEQAGYANGLTLTMVAAIGASAGDSAIFQQIASDMRMLGVDLRIRRIPPATLRQHLYYGNWPGDMFALRMGGFDALRSFRLASCAWPASWRCYPEIETAIAEAKAAADIQSREILTQKVLAADRAQYSALYLWQEPTFDAVGPRITGWSTTRAEIRLEHLQFV